MAKMIASKLYKTLWHRYWIYLVPLLLCSLIMVPRLLDPQFGLMDDGDAIQKTNLIVGEQWGPGSEADAGRFRPLYWYIHYALFMVFGRNPLWHFFVNYLALALLIVGVIKLLRRFGSTKPVILIACALFLLSGPIPESYFTLSKYEIFQLILIVFSILMAMQFALTRSIKTKILLGAGVFLFDLVSYLIKETSLIMLLIYLGWMIVSLIKYRMEKRFLLPLVVMLAGSVGAGVVYFSWRGAFNPQVISAGSYVGTHFSLNLPHLFSSLVAWEPWLRRDFSYVAALIFALVVSLFMIRRKLSRVDTFLGTTIWMVGWLVMFVPWVIKIEYYLLPFALGCSILSAHILGDIYETVKQSSTWKRIILYGCVAVACVLFLNTLMLVVNNARYQLLMDNVNSRMMKYLVDEVPRNGHVYVNLPADNEYIKEIELHFQYIHDRADISVSRFYYQTTESLESGSVVISPLVINRPTYSVRHAVSDDDAGAWSYSLEKYMADGIGQPYTISSQFSQVEPHIFRIICPVFQGLAACEMNRQLLESKLLTYQWVIYQYERQQENATQPGVYKCGEWQLRQMDGTNTTFSFGGCNDTPVVGDWNGDGISDPGIYSPVTNEWRVDTDTDGKADLVFSLPDMIFGDIPLVGDWDGNGQDAPAFFRGSSQIWQLYEGPIGAYQVSRTIKGGTASSIPLVGDWNRDSVDSWGIYLPETGEVNLENDFSGMLEGVDFQLPAKTSVIVADWYGTGRDTLAFIDHNDWVILPANCGCSYPNFPPPYRYPIDGLPVSGIWP